MLCMDAQAHHLLESGCRELSVAVDQGDREVLLSYLEMMLKWNRTYNLTAITQPAEMVVKHLLDSLSVSPYLHRKHVLDVGSGAGLPGIPLAVTNPHIEFVLLDANRKRTRFLRHVRRTFGLSNVRVVEARVAEYQPTRLFSTVISRAFSSLQEYLDSTAHLLAPGGKILAMRGRAETERCEPTSPLVIEKTENLSVPNLRAERNLIIVSGRPMTDQAENPVT